LRPGAQIPLATLQKAYANYFANVVYLDRLYGRPYDRDKGLLTRLAVYPYPLGLADAAALTRPTSPGCRR
jgi:hypothetical protein